LKTNRKDDRAFTLIEVLLVLLILGMLVGVAIVAFGGTQKRAEIDATKVKLKAVESSVERFKFHVGRYPSATEGLAVLTSSASLENEEDKAKWAGPYLKQTAKDEWGKEFHYEPVEEGASDVPEGMKFKVWSEGPNGVDGDEDDIKSWQTDAETP